ncbi:LamG domain-containing protein [Corallococcus exiguus]|uniref:LamG domain-containing protein n=1 Tax=Corallococcus exiguus TaxID=83462 RepID=UPI0020A69871|nr:LamG domain-containing protein [Corallococcus exiguus]
MTKKLQVLAVFAVLLGGCAKQSVKATSPIEPSEKTQPSVPMNGLELWLRSDLGVVASEGRISRWKDQSGHGRDGIMDSAPRQPALVASTLNSLPVVRFAGAQSLYLKAPVQPEAFTLFVVGKNNESEDTFSMILGPASNHPNNQLRWESGSEVLAVGTGNDLPVVRTHVGNTRAYHLLTARYDGRKLDIHMNGQLAGSHAFRTSGPWLLSQVGAYFSESYGKADLAEVRVYSQAIPADERAAVEAELKNRYGL